MMPRTGMIYRVYLFAAHPCAVGYQIALEQIILKQRAQMHLPPIVLFIAMLPVTIALHFMHW